MHNHPVTYRQQEGKSVSEDSQVWNNREGWQLWQIGSLAPSEGAATISTVS